MNLDLECGFYSDKILQRLSRVQKLSGCSITVSNCDRENALHSVLNNPECTANDIRIILSQGASINKKDERHRNTPLHIALINHMHKPELISVLLKCGADVNLNNRELNTPLHIAVLKFDGDLSVIRQILKYKPDVTIWNKSHKTPLHIAAIKNQVDVIEEIVKTSGEVDCVNGKGETPLLLAVKNDCNETVKKLLDLEANPNLCDKKWNSPLHFAALLSNLFIVQQLLKNGACVNSKNLNDDTPLHYAVCATIPSDLVIKELFKYKCIIVNKNLKGKLPFDYIVVRKGYESCVRLLITYTVFLYFNNGYEQYLNGNNSELYLKACCSEVISMEKLTISCKISLYDAVYFIYNQFRLPEVIDFQDVEAVFESIIDNTFPIMYEIILSVVRKSFLMETGSLANLNIYAVFVEGQQKGEKVEINRDCKNLIYSYLPTLDLVNLVKAFHHT